MIKKYKPYIVSFIVTFGIAALSSYFTGDSSIVYNDIVKPKFSPPGYVFGIVWPILYLLMAVAAGSIYKTENISEVAKTYKNKAIGLYLVQIIINGIWPVLFFKYEMFLISFIWIIILWILIIFMLIIFKKISNIAAYMIVPYFLWVSFAAYLNLMIYMLN